MGTPNGHAGNDSARIWFILPPFQHDDGYIDGRSQIKVRTKERTQVHTQRSVFPDGHPSKY